MNLGLCGHIDKYSFSPRQSPNRQKNGLFTVSLHHNASKIWPTAWTNGREIRDRFSVQGTRGKRAKCSQSSHATVLSKPDPLYRQRIKKCYTVQNLRPCSSNGGTFCRMHFKGADILISPFWPQCFREEKLRRTPPKACEVAKATSTLAPFAEGWLTSHHHHHHQSLNREGR